MNVLDYPIGTVHITNVHFSCIVLLNHIFESSCYKVLFASPDSFGLKIFSDLCSLMLCSEQIALMSFLSQFLYWLSFLDNLLKRCS